MIYVFAILALSIIYIWKYKIKKIFNILNDVFKSHLGEYSSKIEEYETYIKIPYKSQYIYIPVVKNLGEQQSRYSFTYCKDGTRYSLEHPQGIPLFISPKSLGLERIDRYDMDEDTSKAFIGDEVLNYDS